MHAVGITGAGGMLGFHLRVHLSALRRFDVTPIHTAAFEDAAALRSLVCRCDVIVHLAYVIVGSAEDILQRNRALAELLTAAIDASEKPIALVFASSIHIEKDSPYGQSKRFCDEYFSRWAERTGRTFVSIVFPHIFGEGGRPFHNSVISTFCYQLARGEEPALHADTMLELMHAHTAAGEILAAIERRASFVARPSGTKIRVAAVLDRLKEIDREYRSLLVPDLRDPLHLELFNTYRSYLFPAFYPAALSQREDERGALFEAVRTRHGGQAFLSTTKPHKVRGNHYHLRKLERFCVLRGNATIRIRRLFSSEITTFEVSGDAPCFIDIPTLHTHNIVNTSEADLITLFWANEIFDAACPDTYPEPV